MATPFPRRPIPVVGESIYGFDRRFAACARFEGLDAFRQATGLLDVGPRSVQAKFHRLATLAGQKPTALDHMRWTPVRSVGGPAVVDLLGQPVREVYLRSDRLRICPKCLEEDGPSEQRIHRQAWQILQVCACPRHKTLLIEACDECQEPLRQVRKTKVWSCACGRDMTKMKAAAASRGAIVMSHAFMGRLGSSSGPLPKMSHLSDPFGGMPLDDLLTVAARLGVLASTPKSEDKPSTPNSRTYYQGVEIDPHISVERSALAMDAAYGLIESWPAAADGFFAGLADRNPKPATEHALQAIFATRMGYQLLAPLRSIDGRDLTIISDALHDWLLRVRGIYLDGRRRAKVQTGGDIHIDVADALRRLEGRPIRLSAIKAWVDAGAVELSAGKVALSSVERTLAVLASLEPSDFDDPVGSEQWSGPGTYCSYFRRSDALRALLEGRMRMRRVERAGDLSLSSVLISQSELTSLMLSAAPSTARRSPGGCLQRLTEDQRKSQQLQRRLDRARENDMFTNPAKVREFLSLLWPGSPVVDVTSGEVRCNYVIGQFGGRQCPRRLYSVVDAISLMTAAHGPPSLRPSAQ